MNERIGVFIDGSNFYFGTTKYLNIKRIDFDKFLLNLSNNRKLIRAYYYITRVPEEKDPEESRKQNSFLNHLEKVNYLEIRYGRLEKRTNHCNKCNADSEIWVEKGVDVNLAADMVRMAYSGIIDTAIIVSGDGDFYNAVQMVKDKGVHVEFAYFNSTHAQQLTKVCDKFIKISKEMVEISP